LKSAAPKRQIHGFQRVADMLTFHARRTPSAVAIEWVGGAKRTYGELENRTLRLGSALRGLGLNEGDRVAGWLEDSFECLELYLACAKAGLVMVPLNVRFQPSEASYQVTDSGARVLLYSDGLADRTDEVRKECALTALVQVGAARLEGATHFSDLLAAGTSSSPFPPADPDAAIALAYTSGTTGFAKGAILTNRSAVTIWRINALSFSFQRGGTYAGTHQSMSNPSAVIALFMVQMYLGGRVLLLGRRGMDEVVEIIERESVNAASIATPLLPDFIAEVDRHPSRLRSMVTVIHGGSTATPEVKRKLWEAVGHRYLEAWGMTENTGGALCTTTRLDALGGWAALDFFASVGRPAAETQVKIVDEAGNDLLHDGLAVGELVAASPALASGYWRQEEASAAAFQSDGYHSGDLGSIDAAGYVYLSDRRTDLIVTGGMNVYPSEVERVIEALAELEECAVVSAPHPRWGRTVVAVVVPRPGATVTAAQVIDHCRNRLASYKKPTKVYIASQLPRTTGGKLRRHLVRERLEGGKLNELT
jgi:fatty-acyl-CoA synthase